MRDKDGVITSFGLVLFVGLFLWRLSCVVGSCGRSIGWEDGMTCYERMLHLAC